MESYFEEVITVDRLPEFTFEQVYMRRFGEQGLDRWETLIGEILLELRATLPCYVTVDQKALKRGQTQRRPGAHVDGVWMPGIQAHGGGGNGSHVPTWNPTPRPALPPKPRPKPKHIKLQPGSVFLLASHTGCVAYEGEFYGVPSEGGDCEHLREQLPAATRLMPYSGYLLSPDCVHESIPVTQNCWRTLLRLSFGEEENDNG